MKSDNYDLDINTIDIENWQRFLDNNEEIESALNTCCSNIADMIANCTSVDSMVPGVNAALGSLKKVSAPTLNAATDLVNKINEMNDYMKQKAIIILAGISYAELAVEAFNKGETVDSEAVALFKQIIQGVADSNIYWMLYEGLKSTRFGGLAFCLVYGTDLVQEGGNFVVGDSALALFQKGMSKFYKIDKLPVWVNATVGAAVVAGFTAAVDYFSDKGEMTQLDWERLGLDSLFAGLSYGEWVLLASSLGGGLPGVIVAGLVAIPTSMLFDAITDAIIGDNIIHTFERNGKTYEVPANGNGEDGTFDVIIDKYCSGMGEYYIGGKLCSEREYKERMYYDLEQFLFDDTGEKYGEISSTFFAGEVLQKALDELAKADSFEAGMDAFYAYLDSDMLGVDADIMSNVLVAQYGFRFEEYYTYNHGR